MSEPLASTEEREHLDRLRHRLYRADATEEDRRAYERLAGSAEERVSPAPEPAVQASPRRRVHRSTASWRVLAGVCGVAVVALGVVAAHRARSAAPALGPDRISASVWDGTAPATPAPFPTPVALERGGERVAAQQTSGGGSAVVPLRLDTAPADGGRLMVWLTSSDAAPVGWLAERPTPASDTEQALETVASEAPALRDARAVPADVAFAGPPPTELVVRAPEGTGWNLTVAFLD